MIFDSSTIQPAWSLFGCRACSTTSLTTHQREPQTLPACLASFDVHASKRGMANLSALAADEGNMDEESMAYFVTLLKASSMP